MEQVDWKKNMILFMNLIGKESNEWHSEQWVKQGISREDAKRILDEYEEVFPRSE